MGGRIPGTTGTTDFVVVIDAGTCCLAQSPSPGPTKGPQPPASDLATLETALRALQSQAEIFAWRFINDAGARQAYVSRIATMSRQLMEEVRLGRLAPAEAARIANASRNVIMEEIRAATSAIGKAGAQATKAVGLTYDQALEKAVNKLFGGRSFAQLGAPEKRLVFQEMIEASGRSSPKFTSQIPRWTRWGKGLAAVTVAISVYNIWAAENRLRQGVIEGAGLGGGALGAAAATASAGFLCGPGAPACVTALFIVGGIAGAFLGNEAAEYVLDQREIVQWLGE